MQVKSGGVPSKLVFDSAPKILSPSSSTRSLKSILVTLSNTTSLNMAYYPHGYPPVSYVPSGSYGYDTGYPVPVSAPYPVYDDGYYGSSGYYSSGRRHHVSTLYLLLTWVILISTTGASSSPPPPPFTQPASLL